MKNNSNVLSLMIMTSVGTMNVSALESVNNNIYYDEKGNYDNPETGEYFHWDNSNARSTAKSFSFKIRYSLKSGSFKLKGTNSKLELVMLLLFMQVEVKQVVVLNIDLRLI